MRMTLDQLRVDSYATQVSEHELTEVKGGSTPVCAAYAAYATVAAAAIAAAALIASTAMNQPDDFCVTTTNYDANGCITGSTQTCTTY
jgi:hypothetical protein